MVLGVGVNAGRFHDSEPQHYGTAILVRGGHRTPLGHIKTFPEFSSLNTDFPRDHLITHATITIFIISLSVQSALKSFVLVTGGLVHTYLPAQMDHKCH